MHSRSPDIQPPWDQAIVGTHKSLNNQRSKKTPFSGCSDILMSVLILAPHEKLQYCTLITQPACNYHPIIQSCYFRQIAWMCILQYYYKWNETPSHSRRLRDVLAISVMVRARKGRKARRKKGGSRTFMLLIYFSFSRHFRQTMRLNSIFIQHKTIVYYSI